MKAYERRLKSLLEQRKIHDTDSFSYKCKSFSDNEIDDYRILASMKLIELTECITPAGSFNILPAALTYFENRKKERLRTWIPISISFASLIISIIAIILSVTLQ